MGSCLVGFLVIRSTRGAPQTSDAAKNPRMLLTGEYIPLLRVHDLVCGPFYLPGISLLSHPYFLTLDSGVICCPKTFNSRKPPFPYGSFLDGSIEKSATPVDRDSVSYVARPTSVFTKRLKPHFPTLCIIGSPPDIITNTKYSHGIRVYCF